MVFAFLAFFAVLIVWRWRHFELAAGAARGHGLSRFAASRGYQLTGDHAGLTARVDNVTVDLRIDSGPTFHGSSSACFLRAVVPNGAAGRLELRPKHEDAPTPMRIGDLDVDTCFRIDASSLDFATFILDDADVRRALFAFGPRGETRYENGELSFGWYFDDFVSPEDIDRALAIVGAVVRVSGRTSPYRA
jgi:hypothetical protein